MSFYPRSGSEEDHNKVLDLNQCPGLTHAAEALDPNFMGGYDFYGDVSGSSYPNFMGGYDYYINDNDSFGLWDY